MTTAVYVDFSLRHLDGRFYTVPLARLRGLAVGARFIGTDHDEFTVECEILAIDYLGGWVYHRPVNPADVPGTYVPASEVFEPHRVLAECCTMPVTTKRYPLT